MKLSKEMKKLLETMANRARKDPSRHCTPDNTGFYLRTFKALEKRDLVKSGNFDGPNISYVMTVKGSSIFRLL